MSNYGVDVTRDAFIEELFRASQKREMAAFCQRWLLHGTPHVFSGREAEHFGFIRNIAERFGIGHHDVLVTGSAKLGFSPLKKTQFSLDSDIDVSMVSADLFESVQNMVSELDYQIREGQISLRPHQNESYFLFLRYGTIGWMRPDKLPQIGQVGDFKNDWFDYFNSISFGKSEVGDYKVSAAVFRSMRHLERYCIHSMTRTLDNLKMEEVA